MKIWSSQR